MKSNRDKISILIVPEGEGNSRTFRVSRLTIKVFVIALIIFLVLLAGGIASYFVISVKASRYEQTVEDNLRLLEENRRIVALAQELRKLQSFNRQIRKALGVALELDTVEIDLETVMNGTLNNWNMDSFPEFYYPSFQLPVKGLISREFTTGVLPGQTHTGVDFAVPEGTLVYAAADGWVIFTGWHYRYGNLMIMQHSGDYLSYYGHNLNLLVDIGDKVKVGQPVVVSGNTGRSTAPHLHFEIRHRGVAIDPKTLIPEIARQVGDSLLTESSVGE